MNFAKFLKTSFIKEHLCWLLLLYYKSNYQHESHVIRGGSRTVAAVLYPLLVISRMGHVLICKDTSFLSLVGTMVIIIIKYFSLKFPSCKTESRKWSTNSEKSFELYIKILDWFWIVLLLDIWFRIFCSSLRSLLLFFKTNIFYRKLTVTSRNSIDHYANAKIQKWDIFDKCISVDLTDLKNAWQVTTCNEKFMFY